MMARHIILNVGGVRFPTLKGTLMDTNTFFSAYVNNTDVETQEIFVDRDPTHFRYILNWLRGVRYLPQEDSVLKELAWEADYYCIDDMSAAIALTTNRLSHLTLMRDIRNELRQK